METITRGSKATQKLGESIGNSLKGGEVLALTGELGSGKTTFIQGLTKALDPSIRIISPTFIIMRQYDIDYGKIKNLYHVDLYRLEGDLEDELENLGLTDEWGRSENVFVIEWAEKAKKYLPQNTKWINFEHLSENERKINISDKI